jgi:putative protease
LRISAEADGVSAERSLAGTFASAKEPAKMDAAIRGAFEKLGETRFAIGDFEFRNLEKRFVPVSQINQLRRQITDELEEKLKSALAARVQTAVAAVCGDASAKRRPASGSGEPFRWSIKVQKVGALDAFSAHDWEDVDEVLVEIADDAMIALQAKLDRLGEQIGHDHIRLALPMITRKWEEQDLLRKIQALKSAGWKKWEAANISAWAFLNLKSEISNPRDLSTDWSVYVTNRAAALQVADMGATRFALSPEDGIGNMDPLLAEFGARATVIVYQDTPLFISESCACANMADGCAGKDHCDFATRELVSSHDDELIVVNRECRTVVISRKPFCLASRLGTLRDAGAISLRADFLNRPYSPAQVRDTWQALRAGKAVPGHIGNFDRGLA